MAIHEPSICKLVKSLFNNCIKPGTLEKLDIAQNYILFS